MSRLTKDASLPGPSASTSQQDLESGASSAFNRTLNVTLLSSEWRSTKGGLSTINRELAIQLAKHPNVEVCMYLPQCSEEDHRVAATHNVQLTEAEELIGYQPDDWLTCLPENHHLDCIIGHGLPLGRQVQVIQRQHHCKWIQVVHTSPEDLGMFKDYAGAISRGEEKHLAEIKLCEKSNQVVAVGPKLSDEYSRSLRYCQKDQAVFKLTPSIFSEFSNVKQATEERETFCVLVFGRGDDEDFELKGYDIAAEAIAELNENSYQLMFVGAPLGKEDGVTEKLCEHGISRTQLTVRSFKENREDLANLFCEVDLAIMPSRTEGFGLAALEALSAGLPVLVSGNSGLGDALKKVPHGSNCVVNSDDSKRWAEAIRAVRNKDRDVRLEETKDLRRNYAEKYSWEEQCGKLVQTMMDITFKSSEQHVSGKSKRLLSPSGTPARKQCKVLTSGPEASSKAQASESGKRPSSSRDVSTPKKRKMLTGESEDWGVTTLVKLLKTSYRRRSQLRPLADSTIQLELEKVYTRLKIISRPKADDPSSGKEVNVYDVFGEYEKGEDVMALAEGSPGIGKTTLCLKLAHDWAVESVTTAIAFSKFELVLLLKCRDFDGDIMEAISEQLLPKDINEERRKTVVDFIKDIRNQERILLILDGLDELPQKSKRDVDQLLDRRILPFCHVFATCRQERGIEMRKNFKFDILLEIKGFTESDACEYIRKHFKHLRPDLSSKGEELIQEIKENTFLHALRNNPLNLLLLCVIYEDYKEKLPSSRTKLYQEIVQCLLRRYCAKHNMEAPEQDRDLEKQFKKDILALGELAWKCLLQDRHSFLEDELKEMEKRNENLVARGLGLLYKEESLKRLNPRHEYCFLHKTFQEYLAACYIAHKLRGKKFNVFDNLAFDDLVGKYRQVFLFVSGLLGEEASLLFEHIGKELEGDWAWEECDEQAADFFIDSLSESENGEHIANTLCSFIPFPLDAHLPLKDEEAYHFVRVLEACQRFSNLQTPVNLSCRGADGGTAGITLDVLASCQELKSLSITFDLWRVKEFAGHLFRSFAGSTSLSRLTLERKYHFSVDVATIECDLIKSNSLTQVALRFPGILGSALLSPLETELTADSPLASAVLTVNGPMNETAIEALEKLLSNESLTSLSFTFRGDMQDLLAAALSRGLTRQISISCLDLCVEGKLSYYSAKSLERGLLENRSLNDVKVFVRGELPENWKTVMDNVRLAKKSQFCFHPNICSQVTTNQVLPFRPFAVKEGLCPNQHLTVNICGELTIEGADALCEVLCPSLSCLTINLFGKLTDGVSHLSTRCIDLKKSLSSVTVNIWGKLTEGEKTLSHDIKDKNSAITLNVHDVPILQDDSSNDVSVTTGNRASLATLLTDTTIEKLSVTINNREDASRDWFDVLVEHMTLKELTLIITNDTFESEECYKRRWDLYLGDCLKRSASIRELTLTVNSNSCFEEEWEGALDDDLKHNTLIREPTLRDSSYYNSKEEWGVGLGDGLKHNTSICKLTLTVNRYGVTEEEWGVGLGDGLKHNTSICELTLTVNSDGYSNDKWAVGLGDALKCNTSIRELTLTVSSYGFFGKELGMGLGDGLKCNTSIRKLTLTISSYGYSKEEWGVGLGDGLKHNTSIRELTLTVSDYGYSEKEWGTGLGDGLKRNTSICELTLTINSYSVRGFDFGVPFFNAFGYNRSVRALTLTINNYGDLSGFNLGALGKGLARSESLTLCNLVFNMHGKVKDDYLPKLCENLMMSKSLTTLTLQVNDPHLSNGSRDYDLSKVLVKSRSLSSIDLTISFYGTETDTSDTSDTAE